MSYWRHCVLPPIHFAFLHPPFLVLRLRPNHEKMKRYLFSRVSGIWIVLISSWMFVLIFFVRRGGFLISVLLALFG